MLILKARDSRKPLQGLTRDQREISALRATAINPETHPILARHWAGPIIVGDDVCCRDDSPLARRFPTRPALEILEPRHGYILRDNVRLVGDDLEAA